MNTYVRSIGLFRFWPSITTPTFTSVHKKHSHSEKRIRTKFLCTYLATVVVWYSGTVVLWYDYEYTNSGLAVADPKILIKTLTSQLQASCKNYWRKCYSTSTDKPCCELNCWLCRYRKIMVALSFFCAKIGQAVQTVPHLPTPQRQLRPSPYIWKSGSQTKIRIVKKFPGPKNTAKLFIRRQPFGCRCMRFFSIV